MHDYVFYLENFVDFNFRRFQRLVVGDVQRQHEQPLPGVGVDEVPAKARMVFQNFAAVVVRLEAGGDGHDVLRRQVLGRVDRQRETEAGVAAGDQDRFPDGGHFRLTLILKRSKITT